MQEQFSTKYKKFVSPFVGLFCVIAVADASITMANKERKIQVPKFL